MSRKGGRRRLITKPEMMVTFVLHNHYYYVKFHKTTNQSMKIFSYQTFHLVHP